MRTWSRRALVVLLTSLVFPTFTTAPSHADALGWNDPAGDMWREADPGSEDVEFVAAPDETNGDIRRGMIRHRTSAVTVREKFSDLTRAGMAELGMHITIRTAEGRTRLVNVGWDRGRGTFAQLRGRTSDGGLFTVRCRTMTHAVDWERHVIAVRIQRHCLGKPRWIKVHAGEVGALARGEDLFTSDVARSSGSPVDGSPWTRRLFRG